MAVERRRDAHGDAGVGKGKGIESATRDVHGMHEFCPFSTTQPRAPNTRGPSRIED